MTAEIVPFPETRPWAKYIRSPEHGAAIERLYDRMVEFRELLCPTAEGDGPQTTPPESAERMTMVLLEIGIEGAARHRGDLPPAS